MMSETDFTLLEKLADREGSDAVLDRLMELLREHKAYHKLFDATLIRKKHSLDLPLSRPTSFDDVPEEHRKEVEDTYVEAAREIGKLFLADGDIPSAWMYLQVIREPEPVAEAIDKLPVASDYSEANEQVMQIALFERVHPLKGVKMMLRSHGMCNTITSLDQAMGNLSVEQRSECARHMVRELYHDLTESVRRQVQEKVPLIEPNASLRELLRGRDWLLEGGNYHIDVSHLSSVVRFARSIEAGADELDLVLQLCDYGERLDPQLQYPGEPPFEDFYPAHRQFFHLLLDKDVDTSLDYFRKKLSDEPDEYDKPLLAYVLVDLLVRAKRLDEAVDVAAEHLTGLGNDVNFSFAELCVEAGRLDRLAEVMRDKNDIVGFTAALLGTPSSATTPT
ncbi:MAG: hypothetical protein KDA86_07215 [Planctomycetaceae bacterium]|nr:hypothetical protein [Planctomycetaceae bacterium]